MTSYVENIGSDTSAQTHAHTDTDSPINTVTETMNDNQVISATRQHPPSQLVIVGHNAHDERTEQPSYSADKAVAPWRSGLRSLTLFNIYTSDLPSHKAPVQVMTSPSHLHTQARVQQRNTYNHTYIKFCPDKSKQSHTKSRQNNLHSVYSRPYRI